MSNKFAKYFLLFALPILLVACGGMPGKSSQKGDSNYLIRQAELELSNAAASIAPQQSRHQIAAARLFKKAGENQRALKVLANVDSTYLSGSELIDYSLLHSELALSEDSFFLARQLLSNPRLAKQQKSMSLSQRRQWLQQRGDLFGLLGEDEKSLRAYSALAKLSTGQQRQEVHDQLWLVLSNIPQQSLEELQESERDPVLRGWYSLANISRETQSDVRQQLEYINQWRANWPTHPAAAALPSGLNTVSRIVDQLPTRIALLLPMQGSLAQAGATIRDGFLAAWYENYEQSGKAPRTRIYDTSGNIPTIELYQQAVAEGAEIVIGPLQKEAVQQLATLTELPVPTIALNYIELPERYLPKNLYQFGLSTTDEARQIAQRAWIEGQRTALAIVPQSSWGQRALETFRSEWEARGGVLHVAPLYNDKTVDFAPLLKPVLHISHSNQRADRLERILGKKLDYTPRRRQDLDMVFMAAYPDQARQIKPTLDFLFARDLQVYGTSQLFNGENNPGRNRDLEGIRFSAMPWTLPGATTGKLQPSGDLHPLYRHMFALGIDAYHLHQWLSQLATLPGTRLYGSTGTLQISDNNTISRQQPWAEFRRGSVRSAQQLKTTRF